MKKDIIGHGRCLMILLSCIWVMPIVMGQSQTNLTSTVLKIAIPPRNFTEFVNITTDPTTGERSYGGLAVEVFRAVMNTALISPIPFIFIPFAKPDGTMNGSFDNMLQAVSSKQYDGAVGEISIRYYRTQWVDFTMPYLSTDISMLVSVRPQPVKNSKGISVRSITKYVVASSLVFSFIVAMLFWILEYRNDKRASSPQSVRNHDDDWRREMLGSMIQTRLVMILFFMVLLVLIACYTASQTSSLSIQPPRGAFKNLKQLRDLGSNVGYREGSFIRDVLIQTGILETNLKSLHSPDDMVDMLSKGTAQGGVDAIVAHTVDLKLLQAKHCDRFTIMPTTNIHAEGFGFAFPIGYPRLSEISKGLIKIIDKGDFAKIQDKTIGSLKECPDDPNVGSAYLATDSLWILIAGGIAVFVLMSIILLLYSGVRGTTRKINKVAAYPCYLMPCC